MLAGLSDNNGAPFLNLGSIKELPEMCLRTATEFVANSNMSEFEKQGASGTRIVHE